MGRTKVVRSLRRRCNGVIRIALACIALFCITLALTTCGSSGTINTPADDNAIAPSLAELSDMLTAELERLGKDPSKVVSAAPSGSGNAVFDLSANILGGSGITLRWTERLLGDYDQNSEVNLSDLAPIAINWKANVDYDAPHLHGGFAGWPTGDADGASALNWRMARVDGDSNSEINLTDIAPIAIHFKERMEGYQIERAVNYGTGTLKWEAIPVDIGFGIQPSAPRDEAANYSNNSPVRYAADVSFASPEFAHYFRVKPYDKISEASGAVSNIASYIPSITTDTVPPYWLDTVGVAKLIPSDESMTVEFGTATDDTSPPVSYRVFWAEGDEAFPDAPFDYGAAQTVDVAVSPYTITGLVNDQYYRVAVRAMDSADVPNVEANTNLKGQFAGIRDYYPPTWIGAVGIQELLFGYGMAIVTWQAAEDSTTDEHGTWENGPVIYRLYYGNGDTPNFQDASYKDFVDIGLEKYAAPLRELDTTQAHWFAIRVLDQAIPPNEDTNVVFKTSPGLSVTRLDIPDPEDTIGEEIERAIGHWFTDPGRVNGMFVQRAQSPGHDDWLTVHSYTESGFVHEYDYFVGNRVGRLYHGLLDENGELELVLSRFEGLESFHAIHFSSSSMSQVEFDLTDHGPFELGINPLGELWVATDRIKEVSFPDKFFISSQEFGFLPYTDPTEFWEPSSEGERDYYIPRSTAQLADGSVIIALSGVASSELANHKLVFDHEGFQLQDAVQSPLPDYTYRMSFGWGVADPIDVHVSDVNGVGIQFVQGEASRHFSMDSLGAIESEYPSINIGSQMSVESLDSIIIPLRLKTDYWYDDPLNSFEFECVAVLSEGSVHRIPVGLVVDEDGLYFGWRTYFLPGGKFGWKVYRQSLGISAIDVIGVD